jgi:trehalose 6-phosphate phosphatase
VRYAFDHPGLIQEVLRKSPLGLITDVDGTISEIAPTPQEARVSPLCRRYLKILSRHLALVAAISGRPAAQVRDMIGIRGMVYIGNHGLERWTNSHPELPSSARDYTRVVKSVVKELTPLGSIPGVTIENKGVTVTIHYRLSPEPRVAEREILDSVKALAQARNLRVIRGKMSLNLLPPIEMNKGSATLDLIREYNLRGGLYLGDDLTDIDAFRALHTASRDLNFQGLAIGVAGIETPEKMAAEADFTLKGVRDVERFLKWLSQNVPRLGRRRPQADAEANR